MKSSFTNSASQPECLPPRGSAAVVLLYGGLWACAREKERK